MSASYGDRGADPSHVHPTVHDDDDGSSTAITADGGDVAMASAGKARPVRTGSRPAGGGDRGGGGKGADGDDDHDGEADGSSALASIVHRADSSGAQAGAAAYAARSTSRASGASDSKGGEVGGGGGGTGAGRGRGKGAGDKGGAGAGGKKKGGGWRRLFCGSAGPDIGAGGEGGAAGGAGAGAAAEPPAPPSLLPPRLPQDDGKKLLVLDLDETLVHSSFKPVPNPDYIIPVEIEGTVHHVYVCKRPGCDLFLEKVREKWEVVVFTASLAKYADPLLDQLDVLRCIRARLFREHCVFHNGNFVKDMNQMGRRIQDVVIVDNSPASYLFQPENAIPCESFIDDMSDRELYDMIPFLDSIADVPDVRTALGKWYKWRRR